MPNSLTLKWGSVKAWNIETEDAKAALKKWAEIGVSMSAMMRKESPEQKTSPN